MLSRQQFCSITACGVGSRHFISSCPELQKSNVTTDELFYGNSRATMVARVPHSTHLIFYIHGGGFVSGSSESVSKYLLQLYLALQHRGLVCDILSIDYDLSPKAVYPTALCQIMNVYRHAMKLNKPIILMGDSAGANLCLGLLQHLAIPNPLIQVREPVSSRFRIVATCLLSPWVNLRTEGPSVQEYKNFDCLNKAVLDSWANDYLGTKAQLDSYSNPIQRLTQWENILPEKSAFFVGGMELFLSDIVQFSSNIRANGHQSLDLIVVPNKCHAWAAVDYGFQRGELPLYTEYGREQTRPSSLAGIELQAQWIVGAIL